MIFLLQVVTSVSASLAFFSADLSSSWTYTQIVIFLYFFSFKRYFESISWKENYFYILF